MKTIYFVVHQFKENTGSYAGFVESFAKYAATQGFSSIIICKAAHGEAPVSILPYATIHRLKLPFFRIPFLGYLWEYILLSRETSRYFCSKSIDADDILLANGLAGLGLPRGRYVLRFGQPAAVFLRNMNIAMTAVPFHSRIARWVRLGVLQHHFERRCARRAAGFMFPSEDTRSKAVQHYGVANQPFIVPYSGVVERQVARRSSKKGKTILFVSAGNEERIRKGVHYLEKILPAIFSKHPDLTLLHVGDSFEWRVPDWCKQRIIRTGKVPWKAMPEHYATSDLIVSASLQEGFPNTLIEAMASGVPAVSSDIEGISEYIVHGETGLIFPRGSPEALLSALDYALQHPVFLKRAGIAAKKKMAVLSYEVYGPSLLRFLRTATGPDCCSRSLLRQVHTGEVRTR